MRRPDTNKMIGRCLFIFTLTNALIFRQYQEKVRVPFKKPNDSRTYFVSYFPDWVGCESISSSEMEACKYYGHCCFDVVRMRERLEPGTYNCINIGNVQGN